MVLTPWWGCIWCTELGDWAYQALFLQNTSILLMNYFLTDSPQQLCESLVICSVLHARDQIGLRWMQKGVTTQFSCVWLAGIKSKAFLWHHSVKHPYLIKCQRVNVLTSNGRFSSPNWKGGTYSFLEIYFPEKSVVARRKNLDLALLLSTWLTVRKM